MLAFVKIGDFVNPLWLRMLRWITVWIIIVLNAKLAFDNLAPDSCQYLSNSISNCHYNEFTSC